MVAEKVIEFGPVWKLPEPDYDLMVEFTIQGEPGRKSNQRRIVKGKSGKPIIIKGEKAMKYAESFLAQVPEEARLGLGDLHHPVALWAHIYYASNRPDVSTELIQDLLEKAGVVSNDRWIKTLVIFGSVDRENPRVELKLYSIC